jgi:hypothetical protein
MDSPENNLINIMISIARGFSECQGKVFEREHYIFRLKKALTAANEDAAFLFNVMQRATCEEGCDIGIMLEDAALARKQHLDRVGDFNESEE